MAIIHLHIVNCHTSIAVALKEMQSLAVVREHIVTLPIDLYNNLVAIAAEIVVDDMVPVCLESVSVPRACIGDCLQVLLDVVLHHCQRILRLCFLQ